MIGASDDELPRCGMNCGMLPRELRLAPHETGKGLFCNSPRFSSRFSFITYLKNTRGCPWAAPLVVWMDYSGIPAARKRKVTICALVQVFSGAKVVAVVPLVTLFSAAHSTAL